VIRHVALFAWTEGMTDELERQFTAELMALGPRLPGVRGFHAGPDAGLADGNFDFAVVADFDDAASYLGYRENAEHRDIIARYSGPHAKARAAVQYEF
jgi:heme-degrading monooxygenase HmoA